MVINIFAPTHWDICNSYGLIACQLTKHLARLGCHVNAHSTGKVVMENQPPEVASVTSRPHKPGAGAIMMGWPTSFKSYPAAGHPQIALTMFESTKLPEGWTDALNTMDAVIVPSRFCFEVFQQCGVTVPIFIAPLGINEIYQPHERPPRETLTFLAFIDRGSRKGGDIAQAAFKLAFGDDPHYQLILKMRSPIGDTRIDLFPVGNVTLIQQDMTEQELYDLYCSVDVLINPNRGEGFGLLPREASGSGCIALSTDWGGTADDIDRWGWPLPYKLGTADWLGMPGLEGLELGEWAVPDVDGVAQRLRDVAANREYYAAKAYEKAHHVHELYSWRRFAETVYRVWSGDLF